MLAQNELIRLHALGDFKRLLHGMARRPGNVDLARRQCQSQAASERELCARNHGIVCSGCGQLYREGHSGSGQGIYRMAYAREGEFWFNQLQHDESSKTVFGQSGNFDGTAIVDLCLTRPACSCVFWR